MRIAAAHDHSVRVPSADVRVIAAHREASTNSGAVSPGPCARTALLEGDAPAALTHAL